MRTVKRYLAVLLSAALVLTCGSCGWNTESSVPALTICMSIPTTDADAVSMITKALDTYVYEKLGFHVQLYTPVKNAADDIREGASIDVARFFNVKSMVSQGLILPLDDLLETHGQGILEIMNPIYLQEERINGTLYTIPTNRDRHTTYGFAYNQEIADRYGLDLSHVDSPDDLTAIFAELKAAAPDITPSVVVSMTVNYGMMDYLFDYCGVLMLDGSTTLKNLYETEEFEQIIRLIYQWKQAGYLHDHMRDGGSRTYYLGSGKVFGCLTQGHADFAVQESRCGEYLISYLPITEPYVNSGNASIMGYAIPVTSKHPELAMQLLNLMYTDAYLANLFMYGIEDIHYTRSPEDSSVLRYPDSSTREHYIGMQGWAYCNQYIADRWEGQPSDIWAQMEAANMTDNRSAGIGFTFDSTAVARQLQDCQNVINTYVPALETGSMDPDLLLPEFRQALKNAGIDTVIEEKQRQLDAYLLKSR